MNVLARLEYELAYYDSAVHCFNHYTTRIPPKRSKDWVYKLVPEALLKKNIDRIFAFAPNRRKFGSYEAPPHSTELYVTFWFRKVVEKIHLTSMLGEKSISFLLRQYLPFYQKGVRDGLIARCLKGPWRRMPKQHYWGRITGLWITKDPHLLKSKEFCLDSSANIYCLFFRGFRGPHRTG